MAEAHQAVVFAFNFTEDHGIQFQFNRAILANFYRSTIRSYKKRYARFITRIKNGIYPVKTNSLFIAMLSVFIATIFGNDLSFGYVKRLNPVFNYFKYESPYDTYLSSATITVGVWFIVVCCYKIFLSFLFSYHGWLYEARGPTSLKTKIWCFFIRVIVSKKSASLHSFQSLLPRLSVPSVRDTLTRYLRSMEPLLTEEELNDLKKLARDFETGLASQLQFYLKIKSYWSANYVSDWWEEFVYLYSRDPLMVNSNYYCVDAVFEHPTRLQAARAGNVCWALLDYWRKIIREEIKPIMINNLVPICSWQYDRMFGTTRIPGEERDHLVHITDTKHIAVLHRGCYYKVYYLYNSRWLEPCDLEHQFKQILNYKHEPAKGENELAALTAGNRKTWAETRKQFFSTGVNRESLQVIENAAFFVVLQDEEAVYDPTDSSKLDKFAKSLLHGDGKNRWFDKSISLVVFNNGRIGFNVEHSWADAPIFSQLFEEMIMCHDLQVDLCYDSSGSCKGTVAPNLPSPIRLKWEIPDECQEVIVTQLSKAELLLSDVDLHLIVHNEFGKGLIKKMRVSPDAFIQMALQLAYFKDSGEFCLTYEASMTRMFKEGRTETVRSCTNFSTAFVRSLEDPTKTDSQRLNLFLEAVEYHQSLFREAMTGKGVDRHLFTLYVVSQYLNKTSPFLERVLKMPWKLSTSQSPHGQTDQLDLRAYPLRLTPGGGFGPVSYDGYGVSYIIAGEDTIFFHVSSRVGCPKTDSKRFGENLCRAMRDIQTLCATRIVKK